MSVLARRTLEADEGRTGAIELLLDSDGASFMVQVTKDGAEETVHWGPDMGEAIARFNSQVDLAWRTLWTVHHRRADGMDLTLTPHEVNAALGHVTPPTSLDQELFG